VEAVIAARCRYTRLTAVDRDDEFLNQNIDLLWTARKFISNLAELFHVRNKEWALCPQARNSHVRGIFCQRLGCITFGCSARGAFVSRNVILIRRKKIMKNNVCTAHQTSVC